MKRDKANADQPPQLRRQAEKRLEAEHRSSGAGEPAETPVESSTPPHLIQPDDRAFYEHELQIHQIELEMQNEELRAAHADIATALRRYTELFDWAPVGYMVLGSDSRIRAANRAACRLLGVAADALFGRYFRSFVTDGDRLNFSDFLAKLVNSATADLVSREVTLQAQGTASRVRLCATIQTQPEYAILLALEDVTTMREAQRALSEADRRKDEFIAVLSHELRNPLMAIMGGITLAQGVESTPEPARKALAVINRQVTALRRIVDDLMDVSRLTRGKVVLQFQRVNLCEWMLRVIEDWREPLDRRSLQIDVRVDTDEMWIDGDLIRLNQIVGNLLGNSIKFTGAKDVIAINLQRGPNHYAELHISDTGRGMSRDDLSHAFEPFSQTPQADDRPFGGLGLGLSIVKQLVELHNGTVAIFSEGRERGTHVLIRLPLQAAPEHQSYEQAPAKIPRRRVLAIEDNVDVAEGLKLVLELSGQEVRLAHDGPSGLAEARHFRPAVVFCDIGLPGMDGYAVARAFREDAALKHTYVVALSGYARPEDIERARAAGFDHHLAKPVGLKELNQVLASVPSADSRQMATGPP